MGIDQKKKWPTEEGHLSLKVKEQHAIVEKMHWN